MWKWVGSAALAVTLSSVSLIAGFAAAQETAATTAVGRAPLSWFNVRDFGSIQGAIDRAPPGAVIYVPRGIYTEDIVIDKKLTLMGDQIGENPFIASDQAGTVLQPTSKDRHAITVRHPAALVQIKDLRIQGPARLGEGDGIHAETDTLNQRISSLSIENVFVTGVGRHGVYFKRVDFPYLKNVHSVENGNSGFWFEECAQVLCIHCYSLFNDLHGVRIDAVSGFQWLGIGIEGNQKRGLDPEIHSQLFATSSGAIIIGRTDFETFNQPNGMTTAITLRGCTGVNILGNTFQNAVTAGRGILIDDNNDGVFIGSNAFVDVDTAIHVSGKTPGEESIVSSNITIANQGYRHQVTTKLILPPMAERAGKGIVVMGEQGILPPSFSQVDRPAPSGAAADGNAGMLIYVPDAPTGAAKMQFSDGEHWRDLNGEIVP
jgi:hypothetical protein